MTTSLEVPWMALAFVIPAAFLLWGLTRRRPLPGKLLKSGSFENEDPANQDTIRERERDFFRIVGTKRDLWVLTSSIRTVGSVLPLNISSGGSSDVEEAIKPCLQSFKYWLQEELGKIPGAIDLGMTSKWEVFDRLVHLTSVTPGFEFIMRHKVTPMLNQPKYLIMISKSGQVRLAWFAFITDKPVPGSTAGPFVVKLVSEDLNAARDRSYTNFQYTTRPTREQDMEKYVAGQTTHILRGIDTDAWDPFLRA